MNISSINRLPKFKKLPELLIYKKSLYYGFNRFSLISTKTKRVEGLMECCEKYVASPNYRKSLYIQFLATFDHNKGYGHALLNFAKNYSKQVGCEGNFHLVSSSVYYPNHSPHGFYRKFGMNTGDKKLDKKIDQFISKKIQPTYKDLPDVPMYYPAVSYPKPKTFKEKLFEKLSLIHI